jgi:Arc/MetJ family transcription regulator
MRTSIEIDDQLMREAMRRSGARTKKAVVETALQLLAETQAQGSIRRLRGKLIWEGPGDRTTSKGRAEGKTDFKRLRQMRDAEIDDSDIPKLINHSGKMPGSPCRNPKTVWPSGLTMMLWNGSSGPAAATRPASTPFCGNT